MDGRLCLFGTSEARNRLFGVQSDAFVFGNCRRYGGLDAVCGLSCQTMEVGCRREVRLYDRRRYAGGDRYFPRRRCRRDSCRGVGSQRYDGSQDGLDFVPQEAATYKVTVGIGSVQPVSGQLRISSKQKELSVQINKAKSMDIQAGVKPSGSRIADYSGWSVYATNVDDNNADWGAHQPKLINGNTGDYIWFNTPHLGVKIDMGATKTVTGLETFSAYGAAYAMSSCAVYTSDDGAGWKLVTPEEGLSTTPAGTQYVSFIAPITARYIIWHMYGSAPLSSEIYVYSK